PYYTARFVAAGPKSGSCGKALSDGISDGEYREMKVGHRIRGRFHRALGRQTDPSRASLAQMSFLRIAVLWRTAGLTAIACTGTGSSRAPGTGGSATGSAGTGGSGTGGSAGTSGGAAGTTGAAGTMGAAGTTGAAGTMGAAGSAATAGTTGTGGSSAG